jgi:hypothetical protein
LESGLGYALAERDRPSGRQEDGRTRLLVTTRGKLEGIFTGSDPIERIAAPWFYPDQTRLGDVAVTEDVGVPLRLARQAARV